MMKHDIIKEVVFRCEMKFKGCLVGESFTPMKNETFKDAEKEARKAGWGMRDGCTLCPKCIKKYDAESKQTIDDEGIWYFWNEETQKFDIESTCMLNYNFLQSWNSGIYRYDLVISDAFDIENEDEVKICRQKR